MNSSTNNENNNAANGNDEDPYFYAILNLPKHEALPETIERRSKLLSRSFHPDKAEAGSQHEAQQAFVSIKLAADVLLDPVLRAAYDFGGITAVKLVCQPGGIYLTRLAEMLDDGDHNTFYTELQALLDDYFDKQQQKSQKSSLEVSSKVPFLYDDDTSDWWLNSPEDYDDFLRVTHIHHFSTTRLMIRLAANAASSSATMEFHPVPHTTITANVSPFHVMIGSTRQLSSMAIVTASTIWRAKSPPRLSFQTIKRVGNVMVTYGCDVVQNGIAMLSLTIRWLQLQARLRLTSKSPLKLWWQSEDAGFLVSAAWQWNGEIRWKLMHSLEMGDHYEVGWGCKWVPEGITLLLQLETSRGVSLELPIALHTRSTSLLAWAVPTIWMTKCIHHQMILHAWNMMSRSRRCKGRQPARKDTQTQNRFQEILRNVRRPPDRLAILKATLQPSNQDITAFLQFWVRYGELQLDEKDSRWNWVVERKTDEDLRPWYSFARREDEPIRRSTIRYRWEENVYELVCHGNIRLPNEAATKVGGILVQ